MRRITSRNDTSATRRPENKRGTEFFSARMDVRRSTGTNIHEHGARFLRSGPMLSLQAWNTGSADPA
jgi:hypothetical protein